MIELSKPIIPDKTHNPNNHVMDNNIYIFLHIILVTSLFTADLTPNFSESNYIYSYYSMYNLCINSTNRLAVLRIIIQTLDKNSCYSISRTNEKQPQEHHDL